ncbi:beta-glucan synthesis-associated protein KRE6 [Coprinellus micaceus]|uniref:Beta-glucan synthesis-associated protein KRE6 n=1 Tax=Coprinellus micaceus TaxID=71717 RepID=A0A4Y7RTK2_COPMI|nr:beta-glucan synthesis-associated protein KRE6 [Coprinellus micaceus]
MSRPIGGSAASSSSNLHRRTNSNVQPLPSPQLTRTLSAQSREKSAASLKTTFSSSSHSSMSHPSSLAEKYSLSPNPQSWGAPLLMSTPEPDDFLHNPDPKRDRKNDSGGTIFHHARACQRFPLISHFTEVKYTTQGGFNLGGINATGQIAAIPGNYGLIDRDTPKEAYTKKGWHDPNEEFILVFSDEFEQEGRTFWPGDDPYWEAVDLHYWGTNDLEWYDPHQVTTRDGSLQIKMERMDDPSINHDMRYRSGMLQSWNKFCFTGGLIEVSLRLPGSSSISGLWPGAWTMGNLGRAGFGASVEGLWPFSYDSCDVGTFPNQTYPGTSTPEAAVTNGDSAHGDVLSYLPGQRLSACTCPGESHPGPMKSDGTYVGRAAPEIDIIEAIVEGGEGHASLSAQWAPFNADYRTPNGTGFIEVDDPEVTVINPYRGGIFQQTTSGLARGCFTVYGFEYKPGFDNAYISWINNNLRAWTVYAEALRADPLVEISARPVPLEPMYIIMNLAISNNFGEVDLENLQFPAYMSVDYVRVYQPKDAVNTGCDPQGFPTAAYIETYKEAYTNNNFTTWEQYGQPWPKNKELNGGVC